MKNERDIWADGRRYMLQWDVPGIITTSGGPRISRIRGEAVLVVRGDHEKTRGLYLDRFGIAAAGVEARKSYTGVIRYAASQRSAPSGSAAKPTHSASTRRATSTTRVSIVLKDARSRKAATTYRPPSLLPL